MANYAFTAHSVRKLRLCVACGGIGHKQSLLSLPSGLYHDDCVMAMFSHDEVLAMPPAERAKLRLCVTGTAFMRHLLALAAKEQSK